MKTTIKSLWALHKDEQKLLKVLQQLPATQNLLSKWAEYAVANHLSDVFEWVYGQLDAAHRHSTHLLKHACVYNRERIVSFLLHQDPDISTTQALTVAGVRGHADVVRVLYAYSIRNESNALNARYMVAKAACEGRQTKLLEEYTSFPTAIEEQQRTTLMRVCAAKNFTEGLNYLLQWGLTSDQWNTIASECLQPYALQSECMLLLLKNIPNDTPVFNVKRSVGDALQRLFTVNSISQLNTNNNPILKALVPHLSFEEFCQRNRSLNLVRNNLEDLREIWNSVQRDAILEHLPNVENSFIKRKM